jgi:hypothetical protein
MTAQLSKAIVTNCVWPRGQQRIYWRYCCIVELFSMKDRPRNTNNLLLHVWYINCHASKAS